MRHLPGNLKEVPLTAQARDSSPGSADTQVSDTPERERDGCLKLQFTACQSRPAGAEDSTGDESVLDLFANQDSDFLPISSDRSDDFLESFSSRVWEDDNEDQ